MGLVSGPVSFRRFRIQRFKHETVDEKLLDALNEHAFGRARQVNDDGIEVGWITPQHLFDVNFAVEKIVAGRFVHFRMRLDRNSAPAAILRSYVEIEQIAALEASDRDFLTKEDKRQAREAARARADKEAKSGAFRRISAHPVLIDLETGTLLFASMGVAAGDALMRLFADTFDAALTPLNAEQLADTITEGLGVHRRFEDARPAHWVQPPDGIDADAYGQGPNDRTFLGREFLSWLWFRIDRGEGMFPLAGDEEVAATLVHLMQLNCDYNLTGSCALRADGPGELAEALAARKSGKQPAKMGLILAGRGGEWTFTLDAAAMSVSALTLPNTEQKDPIARLEERFQSVADLCSVLDRLFAAYLKVRFAADWSAELARMCEWATGRTRKQHPTPRLASA